MVSRRTLEPMLRIAERAVLRRKADAPAAQQAHDELDAIEQRLERVVEQQVRFIAEEHRLGLVEVADLGQLLVDLVQYPQQEGRVQLRAVHQLLSGEGVDDALAILGLHEVGDVEHGLAEELVAALGCDLQDAALDGADACGGHVAVFGRELARVVAHVLEHRAQVFQVAGRCRRRS
jgi:hypothetical protein